MRMKSALLAAAMALSFSSAYAESALSSIDVAKDGKIDLLEAKTAASAVFDKLDKDGSGVLNRNELKGRLSAQGWERAGPEGDDSLTREEYVAFVVKDFERADTNHDGKVDAKELETPEGQALLRLLAH